jgi:predicted HicB family RNase H-like nuclease
MTETKTPARFNLRLTNEEKNKIVKLASERLTSINTVVRQAIEQL